MNRFVFHTLICLFTFAAAASAQPRVEKIDPPNWWTGMTIDPVRVLLQGNDLKGHRSSYPQAAA